MAETLGSDSVCLNYRGAVAEAQQSWSLDSDSEAPPLHLKTHTGQSWLYGQTDQMYSHPSNNMH